MDEQDANIIDTPEIATTRDRFRVRFAKTGLLRWIGHRDLQRLWERMLRRCDVQLSMSEGFHPKPRIGFPSALALGFEGLDEVVEIELAQTMSAAELRQRLDNDRQPGLEIVDVALTATGIGPGNPTAPKFGKAKLHSSEYEVEIPDDFDVTVVDQSLAKVESMGTITVERKEKKKVVAAPADVFPTICRDGNRIRLTQLESGGASLKVTDLLDSIGLDELLPSGAIIRRTRVHLTDEPSEIQTLNNTSSKESLS